MPIYSNEKFQASRPIVDCDFVEHAGNPARVEELPAGQLETPNRRRFGLALSAVVSLVLLLAGLVAMATSSVTSSALPQVLLALSAILSIASTLAAAAFRSTDVAAVTGIVESPSGTELEEKIENLEDLRWQARDDADHLLALLDGQSDLIMRRDVEGRLVFANRAFCKMFDVALVNILGKPFSPRVLKVGLHDRHTPSASSELPVWARTSSQKIVTKNGKKWIEWTHRRLVDDASGQSDIQTIGRDVTDQRQHEHALAAARDEARAADRAKSRFLASMSHEIRTPMNGILGMTGLLGETKQSPEQRTYTQAVRKSAMTLLALIDEILDFSKIEAGHLELAKRPVDIIDCVQGVVELLAPRAYQKNLQLAWSVAPDMQRAFLGDETRLRQVLLNLIGNAVKFTEKGGVSIYVGSEPASGDHDHIKIVIRDTGPGLSEDARSRIFMEFERVNPDGALHESGTGLGLAIAQRLARCMDGGIAVSSRLGEGATFTLSIHLPRAQTQVAAERASLNVTKAAGLRVAIVSSALIERRIIADFLRSHDIIVAEFADVPGLVNADGAQPDSVIFDSEADPVVAGRAMDQLSANGHVDAAVIAASANRAEFERFNAVGIENFLVRPIRPATLLALLTGDVDKPALDASHPDMPLSTQSSEAGQASQQGPAWRILVAEDNEINALLARTVLTRLGCTPVVVPNGSEAIDEVARSLAGKTPSLDAVLMDLHMPMVDGIEATAEIKRLCTAAGAPVPAVIAVTANAFQEDRDRCLAAGMDDYLSKPFEPGDLKRVLDGVANRKS